MNHTPELTDEHPTLPSVTRPSGPRTRSLVEELFGPVEAPRGSGVRRLLLTRSVLTYAGTIATLVQVVVWLLIGLMTAHLDTPWWLWTTAPWAAAVAVLTLAVRWHGWWTAESSRQEAAR